MKTTLANLQKSASNTSKTTLTSEANLPTTTFLPSLLVPGAPTGKTLCFGSLAADLPSIRLVYALCGLEIEVHLSKFLQGTSSSSANLGYVSNRQIHLINMLQGKTIRSKEKLTKMMASLQEDVADQPIVGISKGLSQVGEMNGEVDRDLDKHEQAMVGVLEEADRLRLSTLKELIGISMTRQAVDFLTVTKKLHLCVHQCGKGRDLRHGRGSPIRK
ncbi:hypothetical protein CIPAW_09G070800 [Carya illinoinensis]|uniref:DOG1 domain-containing protein n=1 Tax=Carya illinoinensis TaxID=32201 RepID=A0A8T1P9S8_CARIL|nr:hypothetical protein CIPAW_09G070800 [Carya illinoinensis]